MLEGRGAVRRSLSGWDIRDAVCRHWLCRIEETEAGKSAVE